MKNKHSEAEKDLINLFKVELVEEVPPQSLSIPKEPIFKSVGKHKVVGERKESLHEWKTHFHSELTANYKQVKV